MALIFLEANFLYIAKEIEKKFGKNMFCSVKCVFPIKNANPKLFLKKSTKRDSGSLFHRGRTAGKLNWVGGTRPHLDTPGHSMNDGQFLPTFAPLIGHDRHIRRLLR
jgi:hypothetical protein